MPTETVLKTPAAGTPLYRVGDRVRVVASDLIVQSPGLQETFYAATGLHHTISEFTPNDCAPGGWLYLLADEPRYVYIADSLRKCAPATFALGDVVTLRAEAEPPTEGIQGHSRIMRDFIASLAPGKLFIVTSSTAYRHDDTRYSVEDLDFGRDLCLEFPAESLVLVRACPAGAVVDRALDHGNHYGRYVRSIALSPYRPAWGDFKRWELGRRETARADQRAIFFGVDAVPATAAPPTLGLSGFGPASCRGGRARAPSSPPD